MKRICTTCGNEILPDAPRGLCSVCLFKTAISLDATDDFPKRAPARMPAELDDYELLEEIGRGGQGVVYRARQKSLNRTVALKVIGVDAWASETHLRRFRLEAEAAASLNHPSIVPIYEIREREGCCYFSMRLLEGSNLDQAVSRKPLCLRSAATLMAKVARTVHHAHENGILHRDIKPANILLDKAGEPHLTDFGLARLIEAESAVTRSTDVLGTPSYIAPEQAAQRNSGLTEATDIYGLGAVFYHLLTGSPPFVGTTTYETVRLVVEAEPRPPRLANPKVDRDLSTICLKCLEKDPSRRYSSASELAQDLERWLDGRPIRARPAGMVLRGQKWLRRNPTTAVAGAAVLGLAIALGFIIWRSESGARPLGNGVAVLPFDNLSNDKENVLFAGGIHDELLSDLSKIGGLKVISRTSVMPYKDAGARNLKDIAQQLGVDHIVEGSVSRANSRIRVSVQLIDAYTDTHLWGQTYDRDLTDVFSTESEIAQQIADQLRAKLSPAEKAAIAARPTKDLVAYALYAKAREMENWEDWGSDEKPVLEQIELLQKATERDPRFALAWCALAKAHEYLFSVTGDFRYLNLEREAAETAARVGPGSGETHLTLARYYWTAGVFGRGYDEARKELAVAKSKLPSNPEPLMIEASIERHENNWDGAVANLQRANELDPQNSEIRYRLWDTYVATRRYQDAEKLLFKFAVNDDKLSAKIHLAFVKLAEGDSLAAQSLLDEVPLDYGPRARVWEVRLKTALYRRDHALVDRILNRIPARWLDLNFGGDNRDSLPDRLLALSLRDKPKATSLFLTARQKLKPRESDAETYFEDASNFDAMLGRKEDAIREARHAVKLRSIASDSLNGPPIVTNLARVYALTGARDHALDQLEIVAAIPGGPAWGDLLLNPCWDSLRGSPRFNRIVAAAKAATR